MGRVGKLLVSLVVGGVFLYLAVRNVRIEELRDAFAHLDPRWLVPAVALSLLIQVFRAWRWQLELRPLAHVPFGTLWVVASVAYARPSASRTSSATSSSRRPSTRR